MRLIDADALIEKCGGWYVDECTESGFIGTLENLLATEPTIQPQSTTGQLNDGARSTAQSTDLIDRQAAIDLFPNDVLEWDTLNGYIAPHVARRLIEQLPPAQPEPKEGHWIWVAGEVMCSECRTIYSDLYPDYDNAVACPHCGARMTTSK